jgi:protein TonB
MKILILAILPIFLFSCGSDNKPKKEKSEQVTNEPSNGTIMVGDFLFIEALDTNIKVPETHPIETDFHENENYVETSFPGGAYNLQHYINKHVNYPNEAIANEIMGNVFVSFNVQVDGSITDVEIQRGVHPLLDEEALRVVKSMPNWIPATKKGIKVIANHQIPIVFTVQ